MIDDAHECPASFHPPAEPGPAQPPKFSTELLELLARFDDRPATLGRILEAMQGRGYHLLLLFIALPFIAPIPLPGFSIPFGLSVMGLGARVALDRGTWIPRRALDYNLSTQSLRKLVTATSRIMRAVEIFVRPRLMFVATHRGFSRTAGLLIALSGAMLVLPLPLPFSNSLPAATVVLLSAGALVRDGLCFFCGCVAFILSLGFFALVAFGGAEAVEVLRWVFSR